MFDFYYNCWSFIIASRGHWLLVQRRQTTSPPSPSTSPWLLTSTPISFYKPPVDKGYSSSKRGQHGHRHRTWSCHCHYCGFDCNNSNNSTCINMEQRLLQHRLLLLQRLPEQHLPAATCAAQHYLRRLNQHSPSTTCKQRQLRVFVQQHYI